MSQPVYFKQTDSQSINAALTGFDKKNDTLVILLAEGGAPDLEQINSDLQSSGFQYTGALFPKVLFGNEVHDSGLIILAIQIDQAPAVIHGLDNGQFNLNDLPNLDSSDENSLLIILDGLSKHVAEFLRSLYGHYGTHVVYLGGGAGSLSLQQSPCIFSNQGLAQDQALVIPYPKKIKLGVNHGWTRLMGPLIATEVEDTVIKMINWQPAFEVYKDVVEKESGQTFTDDNFFDIAKGFPFGLEKEDAEDVVRDPIMVTDEGALVCVGEVPENAIIHIMKGESNSLIASAQKAATSSTRQNSNPIQTSLIVDCISRILFLENDFDKELTQINQAFEQHGIETIPVGALTLGEISSVGDGYLEFLNKTVVIGTLD